MTRRSTGFTLLEMIVAIGIFAIIAAISYGALNNFLDARDRLAARRVETQGLQSAMVLMERDLRFAVNRPVRDQFGDNEPAFFGGGDDALRDSGERLRLTTTRPSAGGEGGQRLERVAWRFSDGELSRVVWRVLDRYLESVEDKRVLLKDIEDLQISFFTYGKGDELSEEESWRGGLPAGVEIVLRLKDRGTFRRILQVAGT